METRANTDSYQTHGRKAKSVFHYGLDDLFDALKIFPYDNAEFISLFKLLYST